MVDKSENTIVGLDVLLNDEIFHECIFHECFRCGDKNYKEIYIKDHLFRLCDKCENSQDVVTHFIKLNRGNPCNKWRSFDG